tara:strand:- start:848 stop:1048 length:201 start_codon:yes stop_codon:yes gene_type:complete
VGILGLESLYAGLYRLAVPFGAADLIAFVVARIIDGTLLQALAWVGWGRALFLCAAQEQESPQKQP